MASSQVYNPFKNPPECMEVIDMKAIRLRPADPERDFTQIADWFSTIEGIRSPPNPHCGTTMNVINIILSSKLPKTCKESWKVSIG